MAIKHWLSNNSTNLQTQTTSSDHHASQPGSGESQCTDTCDHVGISTGFWGARVGGPSIGKRGAMDLPTQICTFLLKSLETQTNSINKSRSCERHGTAHWLYHRVSHQPLWNPPQKKLDRTPTKPNDMPSLGSSGPQNRTSENGICGIREMHHLRCKVTMSTPKINFWRLRQPGNHGPLHAGKAADEYDNTHSGTARHSTARHKTARQSTAQHSTAQHGTIQHIPSNASSTSPRKRHRQCAAKKLNVQFDDNGSKYLRNVTPPTESIASVPMTSGWVGLRFGVAVRRCWHQRPPFQTLLIPNIGPCGEPHSYL